MLTLTTFTSTVPDRSSAASRAFSTITPCANTVISLPSSTQLVFRIQIHLSRWLRVEGVPVYPYVHRSLIFSHITDDSLSLKIIHRAKTVMLGIARMVLYLQLLGV